MPNDMFSMPAKRGNPLFAPIQQVSGCVLTKLR